MSNQLASMMRAAREQADNAAPRQEYTIVKIALQTCFPPETAAALARSLAETNPGNPMHWLYEEAPDFPFDLWPVARESRLVDVMFNTEKTAPGKAFFSRAAELGETAVVFKPTDYAAFLVLHNYESRLLAPLGSGEWRTEMEKKEGKCVLQPLVPFLRGAL